MNSNTYTNSFASHFSNKHFARLLPTPVSKPKLIAWTEDVAQRLDLSLTDELVEVLGGNKLLPGMDPIATRYGGHQFGHWAGQLGDGRAIILGEKNGFEIQLKGAGPTPYSRGADGRAVLRSSVREFLCSEAMHYLGIPTTRALALVETGDVVVRDMFYNNNPRSEPGAICTRVAPTFIRFGHFEILMADRDKEGMQKLMDYVLRFYPGHTIETFFQELCLRTADLIVNWLRVGFVHGVLNTDNMSILGLTIDYGPYGWLDTYEPEWTPNTTDRETKRYGYSQQPSIAFWNLERLAVALSLLGVDLRPILSHFPNLFSEKWVAMSTAKLGLEKPNKELLLELDLLLQAQETDPTIFYRELADCVNAGIPTRCFYQPLSEENQMRWEKWMVNWRNQLKYASASEIKVKMNKINPAFILRNYLAQEAIGELENGSNEKFKKLQIAICNPYDLDDASLLQKRPDWARNKPGCSSLSCSS